MPSTGTKKAGDDALANLDDSTEISEKDLSKGQRIKSGQDVEVGE